MLHVIIQKPFDENKCAHFTVGDPAIKDLNPELVISILAAGVELGFILTNFDNIPKRRGSASADQSWFGDDAKFIVANWL